MDKYELVTQIGDGTFGSVAKAVLKKTGQLVAIKKMKQKFYTWEECVKLPEVDIVRRIHGHPNVVKLREVIRENNELFFVFEYMDGDLLGVIKKAKQAGNSSNGQATPYIPYPQIKSFMRQMLQALAYIHKRGYFHRDLKPENLLIRKEPTGEEVLKLADFGLVKEIRSRPPFTDYVSTRWYRAPELLLQDRFYSSPVDLWAAGCIMAELITTRPLFPGTNEVDQLFKIMSVLDSPTEKTWAGGIHLAKKIRYTFPTITGTGLAKVLPSHTPAVVIDLLSQMLTYDPKLRPTAEQCLQHPFFAANTDERNELSSAALDQLAFAAKRLQSGPQSAPLPLKVPVIDPLAVQKPGRSTADGSVPEGSPRKLYPLGRQAEVTPSLKPIAGPAPVVFPGVPAVANGKPSLPDAPKECAAETGTVPGSLPSIPSHVSATKRRSQEVAGTFMTKKLAGLKNVHVGHNKALPMYGSLSAKAAQLSHTGVASGAATTLSSSKEPSTMGRGGGGSPVNTRDTKPMKMNVAQPMLRRLSKETEPMVPVTLSVPKHDVSLDELMEEFASEVSHFSVHAGRRDSNANGDEVAVDAPLAQDPVVALLSGSRFKKTATVANESTSLQPLKMGGSMRSAFLAKPLKSDGSTTTTELPRVEHVTKGVSPALKALLAKHKASAFAYQ
ncbi:putative Mitogen activated protein kinase putativeprotein kinase [Leptomonas pyrrhocoris]|uniref:Putative Mitogen activated protein kinase putativeprotein kinase n=1 Tax=Leptomonas pyrrhocoris TaxID=157538 RepID=A0A0M9FPP7_LEPPY|nr:putative Mitogen activated protein kinase putativeprotein kinase [Leptomonas pyrrhocoris]KPA73545.1 putative Mitogen activated protein kinase putativeprotein kinase [Leptomonas pyrrhocoris]|eukprot:XP_015651984.1 putative Mitogen activated protein kinase putativeprotein kinase [Leptomonas pyrrhocoris]